MVKNLIIASLVAIQKKIKKENCVSINLMFKSDATKAKRREAAQ